MPRRGLLAVSVLQGFAYLWLYRCFEQNTWPAEVPAVSWPLLVLFTFLPLLLLVSATPNSWRRCLLLSSGFTLVIMILAAFAGAQSLPPAETFNSNQGIAFGLSIWLVAFISASFIQQRCLKGGAIAYQDLFRFSWRNFLVPAFAVLFTLIAWLLLSLWGALFDILKIGLFSYLFGQDWFLFPVLSFVFGVGVLTFRDLTQIIDSATQILLGLIRILLPLAVFISIIFLMALIASGTSVVWQTDSGTALMLWLIAINLFGCNAVYQDGQNLDVYPPMLHRFIAVGVLTLPVYAVLSGYGLWLRIDQYGLSLERLYGLMVWLTLGLFVVGYSVGVIRKRDDWVEELGWTNIRMAVFIVALLMLTHSPVMELKRIVVWNQLDRLESGVSQPETFDVDYLYFQLAQPGREAVEELKQIYAHNSSFVARLSNPGPTGIQMGPNSNADVWQVLQTRPADLTIPDDLQAFISARQPVRRYSDSVYLIAADLDDDGQNEYLYLHLFDNRISQSEFYVRDQQGNWQARGVSFSSQEMEHKLLVEHGEIALLEPKFKDLQLGDLVFRLDLSRSSFPLDRAISPVGTPKPVP